MVKSFVICLACGFALGAIVLIQSSDPDGESLHRSVFVCRETGELFLAAGMPAPGIHPDTGRATLWPALYCPECETWSASPPIERIYGHVDLLDCPKCRMRRTFDGPPPEEALTLD
jgi:hypothetical protein